MSKQKPKGVGNVKITYKECDNEVFRGFWFWLVV